MKILWAVKIGDPDYDEQVITEREDQIAAATEWARAQGFDRFRVMDASDEPEQPDFVTTITLSK